jgi:Leucine-rich repeat (LRR) protein
MLKILSVARNNLQGPLPHSIGNLYSLKKIFIDYNGLEGPLPPSIFNMSSLEELNLQFNRLRAGSLIWDSIWPE